MFTKVNVFIELGNDGTYGAYIGGKNPLPFGVIGEGSTVAEAKQDFLDVVEEYKADGEKVTDISLSFDGEKLRGDGIVVKRGKKNFRRSCCESP